MNEQHYSELLAQYRPVVIETPEEHDHMLTVAETLMERGDILSPEERKLLAMTVLLIEAFEVSIEQEDDDEGDEETEPTKPPEPHETLARVLEARGLGLQDIAHVFGNPHIAREALEGKRPISRSQAKDLGRFFSMPAKLFQV